MAHGDARGGEVKGKMANGVSTTSELGVSSITTAAAHTSAASSGLNWRLCRFKWTHPLPRKTKSGFFACAITFQTQSPESECVSSCVACFISCFMLFYFTGYIFSFSLPLLSSVLFTSTTWCPPLQNKSYYGHRFTDVSCSIFSCISAILLARNIVTRRKRRKVPSKFWYSEPHDVLSY